MKSNNLIEYTLFREFQKISQYPKTSVSSCGAVAVLSAEEVLVEGEQQQRVGKTIEIAQNNQLPIIFLGTKLHNKFFKKYLIDNKLDLKFFFPTNRIQDSSRTQIKHLSIFLKKHSFGKLLIISSAYHIPRIKRYCQHYLIEKCDFLPVGKVNSQKALVETEIKKIIEYAKKGDLSLLI